MSKHEGTGTTRGEQRVYYSVYSTPVSSDVTKPFSASPLTEVNFLRSYTLSGEVTSLVHFQDETVSKRGKES